ncbi:hypothetical protein [Phaeobacter sp. HF9A]|uniref:hypothetical protein n=1 Tax=Phaeobacter sp. HF9A TaxID=2721561 RepID=UPI0014318957|nr:hypothetical protein [Phaeobacter sp. HF9A]NIZ11930.1 hypothetical protein [Phaeobacter sp. HF9A]
MSAPVTSRYVADACFRPPEPTRATRLPPKRSSASFRGRLVWRFDSDSRDRIFVFESWGERNLFWYLASLPDVVDVWDQPRAVEFILPGDPKIHKHHFDFLVRLRSGRKIALAYRSEYRAPPLRRLLPHVKTQMPRGFADEVLLVTERMLDRDVVHNASLFAYFRRDREEHLQLRIAAFSRDLRGTISIRKMLEVLGLDGRGYRAAVLAIFERVLRQVTPGRIAPETMVAAGMCS